MGKTASYLLAKSQGFQTDPGLLAKGTQPNRDFPPMRDMYAGDSDVVTDRAIAGADLLFRQAIARNAAGTIVPWNPNATASVGIVHATGTLTYSGAPAANDTVTINGVVLTAVAGTPAAHQYQVGADAASSAANIAALINADTDELLVTASVAGGVVTLTANAAGTGGNAITTTESGTNTAFGAATLAGGTSGTAAAPESKFIGICLQPVANGGAAVFATGGYFNVDWIIWPIQIDTLALRQQAVDRTNIQVGTVL